MTQKKFSSSFRRPEAEADPVLADVYRACRDDASLDSRTRLFRQVVRQALDDACAPTNGARNLGLKLGNPYERRKAYEAGLEAWAYWTDDHYKEDRRLVIELAGLPETFEAEARAAALRCARRFAKDWDALREAA